MFALNLPRTSLKKINKLISSKAFIKNITPILKHLPLSRVHKNVLKAKTEAANGCKEVTSYPYKMVINITNQCNLRCSFCEITYFHEKYPVHFANHIGINTFKKFEPVLKNLYALEFFGNVGEPLTNPDFIPIVQYVKQNNKARLFLNTNGVLMKSGISSSMVENELDEVLVSVHAGTEETYQKLIGETFNQVVENVKTLTAIKRQYRDSKPEVGIAFALNKINEPDKEKIIELTAKVNANYLQISHYYDVKNKLDGDISFRSQPICGNVALDWMYAYAKLYSNVKRKKIKLLPKDPPYLDKKAEPCGASKFCDAPWSTIKFDGCIEHRNSHYVSPCSRIYLFRVDYTEFDFNDFHRLWNHPYLQYMRETVNSTESNPICRFCKNPNTPALRNMNNEEYRKRRDKAVREFLDMASDRSEIPEIKGLYMLKKNPYS